MKSIEELTYALGGGKLAEDIFNIGKIRNEVGRGSHEAMELEKMAEKILEMKEFDKILKVKSEQIRMVKLERMRVAKESTRSLEELSKSDTSEAVKNNGEQFLKLLQNEMNECSGDNVGAIKTVKAIRRDNSKVEEPGTKCDTFIERNIKLAKCGDGILSLTDEEKLRLKIVLKDIKDMHDDAEVAVFESNNEYILNDETKEILSEIDKKLEEHEKIKFPLRSAKSSEVPKESLGKDELVAGEIKSKIYRSTKNELKRLKELDKLLNNLNSSSHEVIDPLSDEELQYLIEESKQSLSLSMNENDISNKRGPNKLNCQAPSKEIMSELVNTAKNNMPNFKFKCEEISLY